MADATDVDFESNKLEFWEKNLKAMNDKKAKSPSKSDNTGDNKATKSKKWKDRLSAKRDKKKQGVPPATNSNAENENAGDGEDDAGKGEIVARGTDVSAKEENSDDSMIDEAAVQEADDIVSGFSDSSRSKHSEASSGNHGNGTDEIQPVEFSLGLGSSTGSDSEEVLMHAMSDDETDIGLEELFSTAAALDVTLETEHTAQKSQEDLYDKSDDRELANDIETPSSMSSIDEEDIESEAEVETEPSKPAPSIPNTNEAIPQVPKKIVPPLRAEAPVVYSKFRTLLYDSDADEESQHPAEGRHAPMPWFAPVQYSTGKWKTTDDGVSVTSDDVWNGIRGKPVLGPRHYLPYTITKPNQKDVPPDKNPQRKYICILVVSLLLLIAIGVLLGVFLRQSSDVVEFSGPMTNISNITTAAPTLPPTMPLVDEIYIDEEVTSVPTTSPTTSTSTVSTTESMGTDFENIGVILGEDGERFGSIVSMSQDGTFLAALSDSPTHPVQTFQRTGHKGENWNRLPNLPGGGTTASFDAFLNGGSNVAVAMTEGDGSPVVAISSPTQVEVYQFDGNLWVRRGQILPWEARKGVSYTSMTISSDASTLAVGFVNNAGNAISVIVYKYDNFTQSWMHQEIDLMAYGDTVKRSIKPEEGIVLSMSATLSGDGNVLAVDEWGLGSPQVIVRNFIWDGNNWIPMGDILEFPIGPLSVALSSNGHRFVAITNHPGKGMVFDWDGIQWRAMGGNTEHGFLPGGSSVALSRDGNRILIGDSSLNKAVVYDYKRDFDYFYNSEEWTAWLPTASLWGPDNSAFGASVTMDDSGNTLGIGAPFYSPTGRKNQGQVMLYG